ncbi:hypothetical protein [Candidatus Chloroploca sp. Khr17]|uniref:hypothetical protein n=1 Tax=Candidatus Chloroploca sp. Khr17 TaxID=2496869 RepID=UPI00101CE9E6|nr:hypothetical protein [Candidatus Chloroploca sp. Khr17]
MSDRTLSVYESAHWGSRLAGVALVRYDARGILLVNEVPVQTTRKSGHFTVLNCVDGSTSVVLSSFLRLVPTLRHQGAQSEALMEVCG